MALEAGKPKIEVLTSWVPGEDPLPGLKVAAVSLCPHGRERSLSQLPSHWGLGLQHINMLGRELQMRSIAHGIPPPARTHQLRHFQSPVLPARDPPLCFLPVLLHECPSHHSPPQPGQLFFITWDLLMVILCAVLCPAYLTHVVVHKLETGNICRASCRSR